MLTLFLFHYSLSAVQEENKMLPRESYTTKNTWIYINLSGKEAANCGKQSTDWTEVETSAVMPVYSLYNIIWKAVNTTRPLIKTAALWKHTY